MADLDLEETPNHHLPRMADLERMPSNHHRHHHLPKMAHLEKPPQHHHLPPDMSDLEKPSHHHQKPGRRHPTPPPPPYACDQPSHHHHPPPEMADLENPSHQHHQQNGKRHHPPPPPPPYGYDHGRRPSRAGVFASIATLLLLIALTALILYLVYRPKTPHFTVVAASVYLLNTTTPTASNPIAPPTASFLAASMQFTLVTRNPHRRTSLLYDHLTATLYYRDQAITPPTDLPPLYHMHHSTVVFSPLLGGGVAVPVAQAVVQGLAVDETYGVMGVRLVLMGRVRYKVGLIKTAHYGVYVKCDVLIGVRKAVVGPVPLLANQDCKVDM